MYELLLNISTDITQLEYRLHTGTDPTQTHPLFHLSSQTRVPTRGDSDVYRGELRRGGEENPEDVVFKLVIGDTWSLESEAKLYATVLDRLQGKGVPRCIGYFIGNVPVSSRPIGCLILEYAGQPMGGCFDDQPMNLKVEAMNALLRIHTSGLMHEDWGTHNILVDANKKVSVIDFKNAIPHPCDGGKCPLSRGIKVYELEPPMSEIQCPEIYDAALEMDIFTPVTFSFRGFGVNLKPIKCAQDLVDIGLRSDPNDDEEALIKEAVSLLAWWKGKYAHRFKRRRREQGEHDATAAARKGVEGLSLDSPKSIE